MQLNICKDIMTILLFLQDHVHTERMSPKAKTLSKY